MNIMARVNLLLFILLGMAAFLSCSVDFVLSDAGTDSATNICSEAGEQTYGNSCYRYVITPANFDTAESACAAWGGHLASVANAQENGFILAALIEDNAWIGLRHNGDGWSFTDGSPVDWTNWDMFIPFGTDCGQIKVSNGKWSNKWCSDEYGYVCKRPL